MFDKVKRYLHQARDHVGFLRYFRNTSWILLEQILRMVAGVLVGIWVARYLGPSQFGLFSYAVAFAAIFGSLTKLGLDGIVIRELVSNPARYDVYMGTAFWLKLMSSVSLLAVLAVSLQFTSNDTTTKIYILIIAAGSIFQSCDVVDFYFQSKVLSRFVSICKLAQLLISCSLKLYFILTGASLFWFVLVSLVDQMTLSLALFLAYRQQQVRGFIRSFDPFVAKYLLKNSWPLLLSGLVVMIYMRIDQIMIKEMMGETSAGIYSAAVRISEVWYFIPMILTSSIFPSIINAKKFDEKLYTARLQRLYTFLVWVGLAVALPMTFLGDWLITSLYGEAYKEAGAVLVIHTWAGIFVSLGVASSSWYLTEDLQSHALYRTALGAITNIGANLILIPEFGLIGAAFATIISQSVAALFYDLLSPKTRNVFFMKLNTLFFRNL